MDAAIQDLAPHHVSIAVLDMDQAIDWYRSILGFEVERRFHVPGIPADGAFVRRPELRIELWCATGIAPVPEQRKVPDSDLRTGGTKHVGFSVPNLQQQMAKLVERGVDIAAVQRNRGEPMRPDPDPLAAGKPPVFAVFIRDPFGTLIELLERSQLAP
jgi:methylmalonyl-CoA/ethylmalonyl-CoA epimerase